MNKTLCVLTLAAMLTFTGSQCGNKNKDKNKASEKDLVVNYEDRHQLRHVRLVSNQTNSVNYFMTTEGYNDKDYNIFPGSREYNLCTFDDGTNYFTLITKSPKSFVLNGKYSVLYFGLKPGQKLNAKKFLNQYVGKTFHTMDNYNFDENIVGVIEEAQINER